MKEKASHRQILKSTGIIGGEQVIIVIAAVVRSKVIALLLGPIGVGISALYQSAIDLVRNGTGFGLGFSAVRDVAESAGTNDEVNISRTIHILRSWVWGTGIFGMIVLLIFCKSLSKYTFGDETHAWQFALLSLTILLGAISSGQLALLQGLRRIVALAKANVLGTIVGLLVSVPLYWFLGDNGIVFAMLSIAVLSLIFSWFYSRQVKTVPVEVGIKETFYSGISMAKLGFFMVLTGLLSTGTMYALRLVITQKMNLAGTGQFQAAWTISSIYLAAVLNAMGADYFPRLSAINKDDQKVNILVNEQTEVALLIAGPLIVGMLCFSHLLIRILYSEKFGLAVGILQWQIMGTFIKVILWPLGLLFLSKRKVFVYVFVELTWNVIYFAIILLGWNSFGLEITGMSYLIAYLLAIAMNFIFAKQATGYAFSRENIRLILIFGAIVALSFLIVRELNELDQFVIGLVLTGISIAISYYQLKKIIDIGSTIRKFLGRRAIK